MCGAMTNKNAIVTSARDGEPLLQWVLPLFKLYAKRCDAKFEIIQGRRLNHPECSMIEKYRIYDLLDLYDRIIYLDADIIIHPKTANLFDIVPIDMIGAVYDNDMNDEHRLRFQGSINRVKSVFGDIKWREGYVNTGVLVTSKPHKKIFEWDEKIKSIHQRVLLEQTLTNYRIVKYGFKIHKLSRNFNRIAFGGKNTQYWEDSNRADVIHFAGRGGKLHLAEIYYLAVSKGFENEIKEANQ